MAQVSDTFDLCALKPADFSRAFKQTYRPEGKEIVFDLSRFMVERIAERDFRYTELRWRERNSWIRTIQNEIADANPPKAGAHRIAAWENGWSENFNALRENPDREALIPRYFGKHPIARWNGELVRPFNRRFDYSCLEILQYWLFERLFKEDDAVFEFGCGTGHNLLRVREINHRALFYGLDWANSSRAIFNSLSDPSWIWRHFDLFHPDYHVSPTDSAVFTCAALEQIGNQFQFFIEYLIEKRPRIVVHIEPIEELLDPTNELNALSIAYAKKRGYLSGFLTYLRSDPEIEIIETLATGIGSLFLDGYQVVVWRPK